MTTEIDLSDCVAFLRSLQTADSHLDVFRCGVERHLDEVALLMQHNPHFLDLVVMVAAFCHYSPVQQKKYYLDLLGYTTDFIERYPTLTWGYYLFLLLCFRTGNFGDADVIVDAIEGSNMCLFNDALFFQCVLHRLVATWDFDTALITLCIDNHRGRWGYAIGEIKTLRDHHCDLQRIFSGSLEKIAN